MGTLFGYLVFLIIIKWLFKLKNDQSLITVFINMFLNFGHLREQDKLFNGQVFLFLHTPFVFF